MRGKKGRGRERGVHEREDGVKGSGEREIGG